MRKEAVAPTVETAKPIKSSETRRDEIFKDIKSGKDQDGHKVLIAYQKALDGGSKAPGIAAEAEIRRSIIESSRKVNEPGEANKLEIGLKKIYGKDYSTEIDTDNVSSEDQLKLKLEKLVEYAGKMDDFLARKYLERTGYIQQSEEIGNLREKLDNEFNAQEVSRAGVRKTSYQLERANLRKIKILERRSLELNDKSIGKQASEEFETGKTKNQSEQEKYKVPEMGDGDEKKKEEMINEAKGSMRQELNEQKGEENAGLFDRMGEDARPQVEQVALSEHRIGILRERGDLSANAGDAETLCKIAGEIKEEQIKIKQAKRELDLGLAKQRAEEARDSLNNARNRLADALSGGSDVSALNEAKSALKEYVLAKVGQGKEWVKTRLSPVVDTLQDTGSITTEAFSQLGNQVNQTLGEEVRDHFVTAKDSIVTFHKQDTEERRMVELELQNTLINVRRVKYEKKHQFNVKKQKFLNTVTERWKYGKGEAVMAGGWLIATKEKKAEVSERMVLLWEKADEIVAAGNAEIEEKNKENPLFKKFEEELLKVPTIKKESEVSKDAAPKKLKEVAAEPVPEIDGSKDEKPLADLSSEELDKEIAEREAKHKEEVEAGNVDVTETMMNYFNALVEKNFRLESEIPSDGDYASVKDDYEQFVQLRGSLRGIVENMKKANGDGAVEFIRQYHALLNIRSELASKILKV